MEVILFYIIKIMKYMINCFVFLWLNAKHLNPKYFNCIKYELCIMLYLEIFIWTHMLIEHPPLLLFIFRKSNETDILQKSDSTAQYRESMNPKTLG